MYLTPIEKALRIIGKAQLARELGLTRAAIYAWAKNGRIPAHYILRIEQMSGVSRFELSPEIYGSEADI